MCTFCNRPIFDHFDTRLCNTCRDKLSPVFAAAPKLLEALQRVANAVTCNDDMQPEINLRGDDINAVFRAIAKAEGRE